MSRPRDRASAAPDGLLMTQGQSLRWMRDNWRQCITGPAMPCGAFDCLGSKAPAGAGIYFLWSAGSALLYIGLSNNMAKRLRAHFMAGRIPCAEASWHEVPQEVLQFVEPAYIEALEPPYNDKIESGRWDGHDRMSRVIRRLWRQRQVEQC